MSSELVINLRALPKWILERRYNIVSCVNMIYGISSLCENRKAGLLADDIHKLRSFESVEDLIKYSASVLSKLKNLGIENKTIWEIEKELDGK